MMTIKDQFKAVLETLDDWREEIVNWMYKYFWQTILIFAGGFFLFGFVYSVKMRMQFGSSGSSGSYRNDTTMAFVMSHDFVKQRLKSPATAHFCDMEKATINRRGWTYTVKGYVDSQNGFGALLRTNYNCTLEYIDDGQWKLVSLTFNY